MNTYQIESSNVVVTKVVKNSQNSLLSDDDEGEIIPEVNFGVDAEFNLNFFDNTPENKVTDLITGSNSTCDTNPSSVGSAFDFLPQSPPTPLSKPPKISQTQFFSAKSLGNL